MTELTTTARVVENGEWHEIDIGERLDLPGLTIDDLLGRPFSACLLPCLPHHESNFAFPHVLDIATRITPWSTWYVAPAFSGSAEFGGLAFRSQETALLATKGDARWQVQTAFHESWHLAETHISERQLTELDAMLTRNGTRWTTAYLNDPRERRARAFDCFAMAVTEGMEAAAPGPGALFHDVFTGEFGARLMSARRRAAAAATRRKPTKSSWISSLLGRKPITA